MGNFSRVVLMLFFVFVGNFCQAQKQLNTAQLRVGDILFQDLDCGELCDAIEQVTKNYNGKHFSHIGLVCQKNDSFFVIEAIGKGVQLTSLNKFITRNNNQLFLGRVRRKYAAVAKKAVDFALQQISIPYDDEFIYQNGKYYCSELLYDAFKNANNDKAFFELEPMTFKIPNSSEYFPAWVVYYQNLKKAIPEGMAGINPGGISRSRKLKIFRFQS